MTRPNWLQHCLEIWKNDKYPPCSSNKCSLCNGPGSVLRIRAQHGNRRMTPTTWWGLAMLWSLFLLSRKWWQGVSVSHRPGYKPILHPAILAGKSVLFNWCWKQNGKQKGKTTLCMGTAHLLGFHIHGALLCPSLSPHSTCSVSVPFCNCWGVSGWQVEGALLQPGCFPQAWLKKECHFESGISGSHPSARNLTFKQTVRSS